MVILFETFPNICDRPCVDLGLRKVDTETNFVSCHI